MRNTVAFAFAVCLGITLRTGGIMASASRKVEITPERPLLLQAKDGEMRLRRPLAANAHVGMLTTSVLFKVDTKNSGSKRLMFITETLLPGAVIPRHRHLRQDEILYIEHGTVYAQVGNMQGRVGDGGTIFIPHNTWVTIKNVGTTSINLLAFFDGSDFDEYLRCTTVPPGSAPKPMSTKVRKGCATTGHVEYRGL